MFRHARVPDDMEAIVATTVAHWTHLDENERTRLLDLTGWLLRRKHWEAAGGLELVDPIRVVIAAQAALLLLGLSRDHYRGVSSIIVYPSAVVASGERAGPVAGTRSSGPMAVHGLARDRAGPVIVAWDEALGAARHPERGHNVVFHEFAHKIDTVDGLADGTPPMRRRAGAVWAEVCTPILAEMRAGVDHSPLRAYGATNPAEFFAVATEAFFDQPAELLAAEPALYTVLGDFYHQDPAGRLRG